MDGDWLDLAEFRALVTASFVPLEVHTDDPDGFRGRLAQQTVNGVAFSCVQADPQVVRRTPELVALSPRQYFKVSLQLHGSSTLEQHGRRITLGPGDIAIYDTSQPYVLTFESRFEVMVIQLPHSRFDLPPGLLDQITAVRLGCDQGLASIVSPFLAQLGGNLDHLGGPAGASLAQNAVDLLQTLFANQMDLARTAASPRLALVVKIRHYIDEHLPSSELTPAGIAQANFISTRHLHSLFHEQGTTVAGYVRSRRLERCHRDLVDPAQADTPVALVGARWGFHDAAHFSRTFKAAYGETPSSLRQRARRPD